jgi:rare lipoprotein A
MRYLLPAAMLLATTFGACAGERGLASYYPGTGNRQQMSCAHRTRPMGTMLTVRYGDKSIQCRVTDRGPFKRGRIVDVSASAARALGMMSAGVVRVTLD